MKKVVVSGATSMIGISLIKECLSHGVEVLAIVRPGSLRLGRLPNSPLLTICFSEIDNYKNLIPEQCDYDGFYHFAWANTKREYRNDPILQSLNVNYTLDSVQLALRFGCKFFIGAGSQAEYGRCEKAIGPKTPVNPDSAYGIAKYCAGLMSGMVCKKMGIKFVWGRIFSVYGPNDNEGTMVHYAIETLLNHKRPSFTKCEQMWDYLYCADAGRAFYLMGIKGKNGSVYCVGSGIALPLYDYITEIARQIDSDKGIGIGEKEYSQDQVMFLCANISSLTEDTGFIPRYSFAEGIHETIAWEKEGLHKQNESVF